MVRHHRVLSDDEKRALLRRLAVDDEALPVLLHSDALARYYDLQPGTVVAFMRKFGSHEPTPYYRVVR